MAKRWINSADVLVDDQGRIGVIFPTELLEDNQLRIDTAPIVGPEGSARTLADLYDRLDYGLFDYYGYPFFQEYLYNCVMLREDLSAIRAVLEDVYDSSQSALRTV